MRRNARRRALRSSLAPAALLMACASAPKEVQLPPQTLTQAPTSTEREEQELASATERSRAGSPGTAPHAGAAEPAVEASTGQELASRPHTIVIQQAAPPEIDPRALQAASALERERRATADAPVAVITDQNLAELAKGGQLTVAAPAPASAPAGDAAAATSTAKTPAADPAPATGTAAAATAATAPPEEYWRAQALKLRIDWKEAVEKIDELEGEVADHRRRFYEEDDPYYRDNQIKPAWDRALDLLADARTRAEECERRLSRFLEEGRRAGALPGWLREGFELEPPATRPSTPATQRRSDDPWEPRVLNEEPRDP